MSLTKVKFHGNLGEKLEQKEWKIKVESIAEAMHAIDTMSKRKLSRAILENEKQNLKYNDEYLMRLAREKYGMVMPGEKMFRVIEEETE